MYSIVHTHVYYNNLISIALLTGTLYVSTCIVHVHKPVIHVIIVIHVHVIVLEFI